MAELFPLPKDSKGPGGIAKGLQSNLSSYSPPPNPYLFVFRYSLLTASLLVPPNAFETHLPLVQVCLCCLSKGGTRVSVGGVHHTRLRKSLISVCVESFLNMYCFESVDSYSYGKC